LPVLEPGVMPGPGAVPEPLADALALPGGAALATV